MADIQLQTTDDQRAFITVSLTTDDYKPAFDKTIGNYRRQATMKGFRKGHVPKSLILKMHGNEVLANTLNEMLSERLQSYIQEQELNIIGSPIPAGDQHLHVDVQSMGDFDFEYEVGLEPKVDLGFIDDLGPFERQVIEVTDELVDEEVDRIRKRYGQLEEAEEVQDEDILHVTFTELDADGNPAEDGHTNTTTLSLDMISGEAAKAEVLGKKTADHVDLSLYTDFDREPAEVAKHFLGLEDETPENDRYRMTIDTIKRVAPAPLDDELFEKLSAGEEDVQDEDGLRAMIRSNAEAYFKEQADKKLFNQVADALIEEAGLDLPEDFLRRWIKISNEKPITDEQLDEEFPSFRKQLTWNLITKYLGREHGLQVTEEEIVESTREQLTAQLQQYGMTELPEAEMNNFVQSMLARTDHVEQTQGRIIEEKIMGVLLERVTFTDTAVTVDEFNEQA